MRVAWERGVTRSPSLEEVGLRPLRSAVQPSLAHEVDNRQEQWLAAYNCTLTATKPQTPYTGPRGENYPSEVKSDRHETLEVLFSLQDS